MRSGGSLFFSDAGRAQCAMAPRANRSSAPCRMKTAACWSMTLARRARVTLAAINSRSTAAVESRSSQRAMGSWVSRARLRANARVDWARGPSVPSMLTGKPSTKATACRSAARTRSRAASRGEILAGDGFDSGRQSAVGITRRNANGLGPEIEADQRAAHRQIRHHLDEREDQCRHRQVVPRAGGASQPPRHVANPAGATGGRRRYCGARRRFAGCDGLRRLLR